MASTAAATGGKCERFVAAAELGHERGVGAALHAAFGDHDAGSGRDQEGWDLGDQAVAYGEGGVGVGGVGEGHAVADEGRWPARR